jgi:Flp pilus assembly pilin Flp
MSSSSNPLAIVVRDDGQALVEYALILSLVALVAVGALTAVGASVSNVLSQVAAGF